jgi:hypothetical protein
MNHAVGRWLKVGVLTFVTAALVACAGAAGKPGAPGAPGEPGQPGASASLPPLAVGTIGDMTLQASGTSTVDLSAYFNEAEGEALTYAATSSAVAVATVAVSGSTLTVTAVADGSATITVTATDADSLTARQTFGVTVGAATTPTTPTTPDPTADSYDLEVGKSQKITVNAGEVVYADETNVLAVQNSPTSWTLTAVTKGKHTVQVRRADNAALVRTITLNVANQAPKRTSLEPPHRATLQEINFDLDNDGAVEANEAAEAVAGTQLGLLTAFQRTYGKVRLYQLMDGTGALDLDSYFTEPDGDPLKYEGSSENTIVAVVRDITKGGFVYVDVLKLDTFTFDITFTATDNDSNKMSSAPLVVTVSSADVLEQDYQVVQQDVVGNFEFVQVDVGFRSDASHELVFEDGFLFAQAHDNAVAPAAGTTGLSADIGTFLEPTAALSAAAGRLGESSYSISATGSIKAVVLQGATASPAAAAGTGVVHNSPETDNVSPDTAPADHVIQFEATAPGRATITVSYTIYVADGADPDSNPDAATASRTLTLNILPVLED